MAESVVEIPYCMREGKNAHSREEAFYHAEGCIRKSSC